MSNKREIRREKFFAYADSHGHDVSFFRFMLHPRRSIAYWEHDAKRSSSKTIKNIDEIGIAIKRDCKEIKEGLGKIWIHFQIMDETRRN